MTAEIPMKLTPYFFQVSSTAFLSLQLLNQCQVFYPNIAPLHPNTHTYDSLAPNLLLQIYTLKSHQDPHFQVNVSLFSSHSCLSFLLVLQGFRHFPKLTSKPHRLQKVLNQDGGSKFTPLCSLYHSTATTAIRLTKDQKRVRCAP